MDILAVCIASHLGYCSSESVVIRSMWTANTHKKNCYSIYSHSWWMSTCWTLLCHMCNHLACCWAEGRLRPDQRSPSCNGCCWWWDLPFECGRLREDCICLALLLTSTEVLMRNACERCRWLSWSRMRMRLVCCRYGGKLSGWTEWSIVRCDETWLDDFETRPEDTKSELTKSGSV